MVVIRLARSGAKKRPFYRIVVTDKRRRRDTNYLEDIGYFNPIARGLEVRLSLDVHKLQHWQSLGAQLSDRVALLAKEHAKTQAA
jgi:small subunit ribosomal protein S16